MRVFYWIFYVGLFFPSELFKASLQMAMIVIFPRRYVKPAIVAVPLDLKTDWGISLLAITITLTPGTLALDVSKDKKSFVRALYSYAQSQCIYSGHQRNLRKESANAGGQSMSIDGLRDFFFNIFMLVLSVSLFFVFARLKKGPTLADRVVAFEVFCTILLTAVAFAAVLAEDPLYFDIAIILAFFNFLGTAIFARFIDRQGKQPREGVKS